MTFTLIIGFYVECDQAALAIPRYGVYCLTHLENAGSAHYGTGLLSGGPTNTPQKTGIRNVFSSQSISLISGMRGKI